MQLSYALCRAQDRLHLDRALSTTLPNVRMLSQKASEAWGLEAQVAKKREAREGQRSKAATTRAEQKLDEIREAYDRQFSENPDIDLTFKAA